MPLEQDAVDYLPELARVTHGFVGADLMEVCREAGLQALRRNSEFLKDYKKALRFEAKKITVRREDFEHALKKIRPSAMREVLVTIPSVRWQDVGGLRPIKERLRELIEMPLKKPEVFQQMNMTPENGILLHGPSGTGKTLLAKAVANECGINFISVEGPEVFGQWLGESEETLRHIFTVARQTAPTIIFFDQIERSLPPGKRPVNRRRRRGWSASFDRAGWNRGPEPRHRAGRNEQAGHGGQVHTALGEIRDPYLYPAAQ